MRQEKEKTRNRTDVEEHTKTIKVAEALNKFVYDIRETKNGLDYLIQALESRSFRLELLEEDDFTLNQANIAGALLVLLVEQIEELREKTSECRERTEKLLTS